jgi:hypothetical protein
VACILAQVVNLVLGRIQGIWRFQRPPEVIDLDRELGGLNK